MKKYTLIFFYLACIHLATAQNEAKIWYFGKTVGLDFNQSPPTVLNYSKLYSAEGSASISDKNGKLLFYTNGIFAYNRKHETMLNGASLLGEVSSTDNALIVPMPGDNTKYFLFTVGSNNQDGFAFCYNIVDMKGDGGYGEVTTKNVIVLDDVPEKLAAVRHCNKRDVWIVVHKWNTSEYYSYLLTPAGLNLTPVISNSGLLISGLSVNAIGTLKFNSQGNKLVACHAFENDAIELMDFDNITGNITNPKLINPNSSIPRGEFDIGVYGAEFSPDGTLLYVSSNNSKSNPSVLYQFNITSNNAATITASKQIISQTTPWAAGKLQLATDKKIYMTMLNDGFLSVIDNPNTYGSGCNFIFNKIRMDSIAASPLQYGLPTFMQSYFNIASNPYDFKRSGNCTDLTVSFTLNKTIGIDSVKWDFGDTQNSQLLQPTHTYATPGFYDVKLIVYKIDCSGLNDTATRKIWIADSATFLGPDTSSCKVLSLTIGVEEALGANYLWNTGSKENKITIPDFGDYWLEIEQNGCRMRDTIKVTAKSKPVVSLGADTIVCKYKPVILTPLNSGYNSYLWSTGETTSNIQVNKPGAYYVTVTQGLCDVSDTINVLPGDCDIYIPSAFTPNNDAINETFGVVDYSAVQSFLLQVYNKWGQLIFSSNDITEKWNGTFKGKPQPNGAYIWMLNYVNRKGRKIYDQGTVMLLR